MSQAYASGITVIAGLFLGGIEQAVSRPDLALGHVQVALHRATQLGVASDEERLLRLILVALLMADSRRLGGDARRRARRQVWASPSGYGAVARLYHLLSLIAQTPDRSRGAGRHQPHVTLLRRFAIHAELRWLQGRHKQRRLVAALHCAVRPARWLAWAIPAGVQRYSLRAAELRCRYMDGVAELCDRQIALLRHQLGPMPSSS